MFAMSYIRFILIQWWISFLQWSKKRPKKEYFSEKYNPLHWMEMSSIQRYGCRLENNWCDRKTTDDTSHYRQFRSRQDGAYFPNGEEKWYVGHHWRDFVVPTFFFSIDKRINPRNTAYDLNLPIYGKMNKTHKLMDTHNKQNVYRSVGKKFLIALLSTVIFTLLYSKIPSPSESTAQPQIQTVIQQDTKTQEQLNALILSNQRLTLELNTTQQTLNKVVNAQQTQLALIEEMQKNQEEQMDQIRKRLNRLKQKKK